MGDYSNAFSNIEKMPEKDLRNENSLEKPLQVAEVTAGPSFVCERKLLTRDDVITGECAKYDAYLSFAEDDIEIAFEVASKLESSVGLKLFIAPRDMLSGCLELDTSLELIMNRCRHFLMILTPNFIRMPSLEFQVGFATALALERNQRILIGAVFEPCEFPPVLKNVSKIYFTNRFVVRWAWKNLVLSLLPMDKRIGACSIAEEPAYIPQLSETNTTCRNRGEDADSLTNFLNYEHKKSNECSDETKERKMRQLSQAQDLKGCQNEKAQKDLTIFKKLNLHMRKFLS